MKDVAITFNQEVEKTTKKHLPTAIYTEINNFLNAKGNYPLTVRITFKPKLNLPFFDGQIIAHGTHFLCTNNMNWISINTIENIVFY
jgi:hypothetical protein